ncbi:hypothetical protein GCM10023063_49900 [Arthrobacter methylotrophus]
MAGQDEMIAISGSLTLLTNLVIGWNTQRMQITVDAWRGKGQRIDDDCYAGWDRRNRAREFPGILSFPIHLYQDALLEVPQRRAAS